MKFAQVFSPKKFTLYSRFLSFDMCLCVCVGGGGGGGVFNDIHDTPAKSPRVHQGRTVSKLLCKGLHNGGGK